MVKKLNSNVFIQSIAIIYFAASFLNVAFSFSKYIMGICSMLIALYALALNGENLRIRLDTFHLYTSVFLIFCFISTFWAVNTDFTLEKSIVILRILVVIFLIYLYYQYRSVDDLLIVAMIGGYIVCVIVLLDQGLMVYLNGILNGIRIENENYINANTLGMLSASSIVINFYYLIYKKKIKLWYLLSIAAFICMLGSSSKKSILLLISGCLLLAILKNIDNKQFLKSVFRVLSICLFAIFLIYILSKTRALQLLSNRFEYLFNYLLGKGEADHSTLERVAMMKAGIRTFKDHMFLGVGIDNPKLFNVKQVYLHNNYIELLAGGGIIGFALYYSMYLYLLYSMYKYRSLRTPEFDICLTLLIIHLILEYAYVSYFNKETYFYFMIFFFEVERLKQMRQNQTVKHENDIKEG